MHILNDIQIKYFNFCTLFYTNIFYLCMRIFWLVYTDLMFISFQFCIF